MQETVSFSLEQRAAASVADTVIGNNADSHGKTRLDGAVMDHGSQTRRAKTD